LALSVGQFGSTAELSEQFGNTTEVSVRHFGSTADVSQGR